MDGIGNEVTQQIRNAIKSKLTELGAYVDDELPDYIMVMVANKKTKAQMIEDLSLFLGNSTEAFTTWLHNVLDRLQCITIGKPQIKEGTLSEESTKSISSSTQNVVIETSKEPITNIINPSEILNTKSTNADRLFLRREKKIKLIESEENEDFLALKDEPDIDDPLVEELKEDTAVLKISKCLTNTMEKAVAKRQNVVAPLQKSPTTGGSQKTNEIRKRIGVPEIKPKIQRPFSTVGAVVKRAEKFVEEEEYDPHNPSVSSIICVTERRPSIPPALQANKLLLLKAVEDAHKSIVNSEKKVPARVEPYKPTPIKKLYTRPHKELLVSPPESEMEDILPDDSDIYLDTIDAQEQDTRTVISCKETAHAVDEKLDATNEKPKTLINTAQLTSSNVARPKVGQKRKADEMSVAEDSENMPHFVVTLDGVDPSNFMNKKIRRNVVSNQAPLSVSDKYDLESVELMSVEELSQPDDEEMEEQEEQEEIVEKIQERCRYWPACKRGDTCEYHHPTVSCKTFPNCKFGEKCLYIHPNCKFDALCTRRDCPFTHASKRAFPTTPVPFCVVIKPKVSPTKKMCRYSTSCSNPKCPFLHPKPCRYGANCQTPNCTFLHTSIPLPSQLKWTAPKLVQSRSPQ